MKRLFRSQLTIEAQSLQDLLARAGVQAEVIAQTGSFLGEGAILFGGSTDVWVQDEDFERAVEVKKDWLLECAARASTA
jgi:hypothetical protein